MLPQRDTHMKPYETRADQMQYMFSTELELPILCVVKPSMFEEKICFITDKTCL